MATSRDNRGIKANAPMSVPYNNAPDGQHFRDLTEFLKGKREVTVRAKRVKQFHGWGPGDDLSNEARTVGLCPGAVARLVVHPSGTDPQNAMVVAYGVARGYIDIVPDKEFDKAPTHDEVWLEKHKADSARELKNMETPAPGTIIAVLQDRVAKLEAQLAATA